jgi:hypothetical protein
LTSDPNAARSDTPSQHTTGSVTVPVGGNLFPTARRWQNRFGNQFPPASSRSERSPLRHTQSTHNRIGHRTCRREFIPDSPALAKSFRESIPSCKSGMNSLLQALDPNAARSDTPSQHTTGSVTVPAGGNLFPTAWRWQNRFGNEFPPTNSRSERSPPRHTQSTNNRIGHRTCRREFIPDCPALAKSFRESIPPANRE